MSHDIIMNLMGKLEEKIAVITGGNSGIGLAAAQLFVAVFFTVQAAATHLNWPAVTFNSSFNIPIITKCPRSISETKSRLGKLTTYKI
jgi:hypothetical protein